MGDRRPPRPCCGRALPALAPEAPVASRVDRRVVHALGKGRTLAELRRLDAACYGQPRLGRSEAMAVPFIELVAMCDGHPQHSVPPEAALFIASNNNSKRLRTR